MRLSVWRLSVVVSVYYFGFKPLLRGVWLALWRLCFYALVLGMPCRVILRWVGLGRLGLLLNWRFE